MTKFFYVVNNNIELSSQRREQMPKLNEKTHNCFHEEQTMERQSNVNHRLDHDWNDHRPSNHIRCLGHRICFEGL